MSATTEPSADSPNLERARLQLVVFICRSSAGQRAAALTALKTADGDLAGTWYQRHTDAALATRPDDPETARYHARQACQRLDAAIEYPEVFA